MFRPAHESFAQSVSIQVAGASWEWQAPEVPIKTLEHATRRRSAEEKRCEQRNGSSIEKTHPFATAEQAIRVAVQSGRSFGSMMRDCLSGLGGRVFLLKKGLERGVALE